MTRKQWNVTCAWGYLGAIALAYFISGPIAALVVFLLPALLIAAWIVVRGKPTSGPSTRTSHRIELTDGSDDVGISPTGWKSSHRNPTYRAYFRTISSAASCSSPFVARMLVRLVGSGSPLAVVTLPPASSTNSRPAAKSQGARSYSK